jgi:hypothetical protein
MRITSRELRNVVREEILRERSGVQAQVKDGSRKSGPPLSSPADPFPPLPEDLTADMSQNWTLRVGEEPETDYSYGDLFSDKIYVILSAYMKKGGTLSVKGAGSPGFPFRIYDLESLKKFLGRP